MARPRTWYRVVGELDPGAPKTPVVICHGGPGAAHDYCEPMADLSRFGRPCVLYDQLGCGKSELLPDAPADFWTPQLFKDPGPKGVIGSTAEAFGKPETRDAQVIPGGLLAQRLVANMKHGSLSTAWLRRWHPKFKNLVLYLLVRLPI